MKALPLKQTVDCECADYHLSQPVLLYNRYAEQQVYGCLCCGKLSCVHPMSKAPRGSGPFGGANFIISLDPDITRWLDRWPRLLTLGCQSDQPLWLPAGNQVASRAELSAAIDAAEAEQTAIGPAERLLRCLKAEDLIAPPPDALPEFLRFYGVIWERLADLEALGAFLTACGCRR